MVIDFRVYGIFDEMSKLLTEEDKRLLGGFGRINGKLKHRERFYAKTNNVVCGRSDVDVAISARVLHAMSGEAKRYDCEE